MSDNHILHEARFRALGSECRVVSDISAASVHAAIQRLEDLEARWSRFRTDSEITGANLAAGRWTDVSAVTQDLIERARLAHERTGGRFDPRLGRTLVGLGYDRSHEKLETVSEGDTSETVSGAVELREPTEWDIDINGAAIRVAPGTAFDPGGLGKGLAADIAMSDLLDAGAQWALVSLGGDLRFGGALLAERGWGLQIEDPLRLGTVWGEHPVHGGAICTSSTQTRRWVDSTGSVQHHLLDPRSGSPARSPIAAATVAADECWWADVVAKVAVIDHAYAVQHAEQWNAAILAFGHDHEVTATRWDLQS